MKKLYFDTPAEFEKLFSKKTREVTDGIVVGIETAIQERKKSAPLFHIIFTSEEVSFEISLPKSEWVGALKNCLDYYHEHSETDLAIDCWKLLECAKLQ